MKNIALVTALAAFAAVSTPAYAQGTDWSGPYIGVGGGVVSSNHKESSEASASGVSTLYGFHNPDVDIDHMYRDVIDAEAAGSGRHGRTTIFGTVEAGYDHQIGGGVVGVFANYDFGSRKRTNFAGSGAWTAGDQDFVVDCEDAPCVTVGDPLYGTDIYNGGAANITGAVRQKDSWAVGARAGGLVGNNSTLLYVTAGYTQSKVQIAGIATLSPGLYESFLDDATLADRSVDWSRSKWKSGYFVGAGAETKVTDNVSVKLEYRFSDFGKLSASGSDADVFTSEINPDYSLSMDAAGGTNLRKIQRHAVRLVLGYHF